MLKTKDYLKRLFIFIVVSFFFMGCIQAKEPEAKEADTKETNTAFDFRLQDLNQKTFTLSSYKDKQTVILFFWTTWCPFCRDELRILNERYLELVKDGIELLAIDIGESGYKVDRFVRNYALAFKILLDKEATVAYAYDILGVPTYIFIDKKGNIVFRSHSFPQQKYKEIISK